MVYQRLFKQHDNVPLSTHTTCRLGTWYLTPETQALYANNRNFQQLNALHAAQEHNRGKALQKINDMESASLSVSTLLDRLSHYPLGLSACQTLLTTATPANTAAPAMMPATALSKVGTTIEAAPNHWALLCATASTQ